ncbi:MAG: hypothetical protein ABSH06_28850, partial [Thermodesulfobacteriota bacterium]
SDEPLDCPFSSMYSFGLHGISPSDTMIPYVALFMQGYISRIPWFFLFIISALIRNNITGCCIKIRLNLPDAFIKSWLIPFR